MAATVHHPNCPAVKHNDAAYCACGGSLFPVHKPDPMLEHFMRKLASILKGGK